MVYVQLMPTSRKEKSSFLTCLQTLEQTGPGCAALPVPRSWSSPLPLSPPDKCQGVRLFIPIRLHITVTLLWMPHPWGELTLFEWLCVMFCWNHDLLELFSIPQNDGAALV